MLNGDYTLEGWKLVKLKPEVTIVELETRANDARPRIHLDDAEGFV